MGIRRLQMQPLPLRNRKRFRLCALPLYWDNALFDRIGKPVLAFQNGIKEAPRARGAARLEGVDRLAV